MSDWSIVRPNPAVFGSVCTGKVRDSGSARVSAERATVAPAATVADGMRISHPAATAEISSADCGPRERVRGVRVITNP